MPKDLFSDHAKDYAMFRPDYPSDLYKFIFDQVSKFNNAWDCGTGNGQVAKALASRFKMVNATDISQSQLSHAIKAKNIVYQLSSAEQTKFERDSFDLITAGQAIHWFDREKFYSECYRVARKNAIVALFGYSPIKRDKTFDLLIEQFYYTIIYDYWETERKIVEDEYKSLDFPFIEIPTPGWKVELNWSLDQVEGYINTWSAVKKFIKQNGFNPTSDLMEQLKPLWGTGSQSVYFPVFAKVGRIIK